MTISRLLLHVEGKKKLSILTVVPKQFARSYNASIRMKTSDLLIQWIEKFSTLVRMLLQVACSMTGFFLGKPTSVVTAGHRMSRFCSHGPSLRPWTNSTRTSRVLLFFAILLTKVYTTVTTLFQNQTVLYRSWYCYWRRGSQFYSIERGGRGAVQTDRGN